MPEALTIVVGVTTIVSNIWKISKDVYELIDGIKNAPTHLKAVSQDVRGLYVVLGSLQELLVKIQEDQLPPAAMPVFELLDEPMKNCFTAFVELQKKINKYTKRTGAINESTWKRSWWFFTEKDTNAWRVHLAAYKSTVTIALGVANLGNTTRNIHATQDLEVQVLEMRKQLEGLENNDQDNERQSILGENGSQATDSHFALHRFLETAESAFSGSPPASPPIPPTRASSISPRPPPLPPKDAQSINRLIQGRSNIHKQKVPQVSTRHVAPKRFLETAKSRFTGHPLPSTSFPPDRERIVIPPSTALLSPKSPNSRNAAPHSSALKKAPQVYGWRNELVIGLTRSQPAQAEKSRNREPGIGSKALAAVAVAGLGLGWLRHIPSRLNDRDCEWSDDYLSASDDEGSRRETAGKEYDYYSDDSYSDLYRDPSRNTHRSRFRPYSDPPIESDRDSVDHSEEPAYTTRRAERVVARERISLPPPIRVGVERSMEREHFPIKTVPISKSYQDLGKLPTQLLNPQEVEEREQSRAERRRRREKYSMDGIVNELHKLGNEREELVKKREELMKDPPLLTGCSSPVFDQPVGNDHLTKPNPSIASAGLPSASATFSLTTARKKQMDEERPRTERMEPIAGSENVEVHRPPAPDTNIRGPRDIMRDRAARERRRAEEAGFHRPPAPSGTTGLPSIKGPRDIMRDRAARERRRVEEAADQEALKTIQAVPVDSIIEHMRKEMHGRHRPPSPPIENGVVSQENSPADPPLENHTQDEVIKSRRMSKIDNGKKKPELRRPKKDYHSTLDPVPELQRKPSLPYPTFSIEHAKEAALQKHQSQDAPNGKKERRRRRTKSRSWSDSLAECYEEHEHDAISPMPLMSDVNGLKITRSSILSVKTERVHLSLESPKPPLDEPINTPEETNSEAQKVGHAKFEEIIELDDGEVVETPQISARRILPVCASTEPQPYALPEDGSPITILKKPKANNQKPNRKSETALLIEYFEGGKGGTGDNRRPSVRVKATPSSKSKAISNKDYIQITERKGTRKPAYTKRITLDPIPKPPAQNQDGPFEVEVMPQNSSLEGMSSIPPYSFLDNNTNIPEASEISSIPTYPFLDNDLDLGRPRSLGDERGRGISKSSINNPRLVATVEDVIRRLILPELSASPPVSVKAKIHGDKDRNITLRRLTEKEAALERDVRRMSSKTGECGKRGGGEDQMKEVIDERDRGLKPRRAEYVGQVVSDGGNSAT